MCPGKAIGRVLEIKGYKIEVIWTLGRCSNNSIDNSGYSNFPSSKKVKGNKVMQKKERKERKQEGKRKKKKKDKKKNRENETTQ